jgi:hypothetical protein
MDSVAAFFKNAFTVVLALALSEAFKQFVTDRFAGEGPYQEPKSNFPIILWTRLPALLSFLFLIWPFFQGMNRYFYVTYQDGSMPQPYSLYLSLDGILFTVEAALFFVMSRALPLSKWKLFYLCALGLLIVDSVWGGTALTHTNEVRGWLFLNLISIPALSIILLILGLTLKDREVTKSKLYYFIVLGMPVLVATRTVIDYWKMWSFYFPGS